MAQTDTTVEAARAGDRAAFAELIRRYQDMAFGYALSILGDYHAAEDATQEAFVSAYFGLASLRDPVAFPGWLRGIVRNHCLRLIRGRRATLVSLDDTLDLSAPVAGPEEQAERSEVRDRVLGAVMDLPDDQREIVALYYIGDHSQREIAGFLELPVTTVNNRLYAARQRLKGGLMTVVKDDLQSHALPRGFAEKVGKIIAKALDLFCPLPAGGTFGLYGPHGAGKLVVLAEILHRMKAGQEITLLNFVQTGAPELMRPPDDDDLPNAAGAIETFYLPVEDSAEPSSQAVAAVTEALQGALYMSRAMALAGLYPCIDPLVSWSRLLTPEVVGMEHVEVAEQAREVLRRYQAQQEHPDEAQTAEARTLVATAERLRAYLTQPFHTAEPYTKIPGEHVPVTQTARDCGEILSGRYNGVPVEAFRFAGSLEQILSRGS